MRFDFCKGGDYRAASPLASALAMINWRSQPVEAQNGRVAYILLPTSGVSLFANLNTAAGVNLPSVRGAYTASGRTFFVAGTHLFEVTSNGGIIDYGGTGTANNNIIDDGLPVTMTSGGTVGGAYPSQLLICSGGALTVLSLVSNTFQALTTPPINNLMIDFLGGFFAALSAGNIWSVSAAEDATTWPGTSVSQVSVFSDQLLALIECNELIWVMGAKHIAAYYLSGANIFPFDVVSGGVISMGIIAQYSAARIQTRRYGKSLAWLGGDDQGAGVVYMLNGYIPQRVSDSALEYWLSQNTIADAVGIPVQEEGQNYYELWFPSAKTTWRMDVDTGWWHRLSSVVGGVQADHLARCHTYNFGLHLVGDRTTGKVYSMSSSFLTENTGPGVFTPIIRTRIGPTIENEGGQLTVPINEFQLDVETGMGPQPALVDGFGNPRDPVAMVSYSEDFAKTWGAERMIPCGQAGQYKAVAIDRRLGSWRSWTPKVTVSDPIQWRIADAYVNGTQDQQERYAKRMARVG